MLMDYLFLVGPFIFLLYRSIKEYQGFLYAELLKNKARVLIALLLLIVHTSLLFQLGSDEFYFDRGQGKGGSIGAFLFPGLGYAALCFNFTISNSVFGSYRTKVQEMAITIIGSAFICYGYFSIFLYWY